MFKVTFSGERGEFHIELAKDFETARLIALRMLITSTIIQSGDTIKFTELQDE